MTQAPGHTDLMVSPEEIDAFLAENPPGLTDAEFRADNPLPWTMGDGCILDANGRDVPMYAPAMLRFVLANWPGQSPENDA
jgi:hypothetical protein